MTRRRLNNSVAVALCSAGVIAFTAACGDARDAPGQIVVMVNDSPPPPMVANALERLVDTAYCRG
jgi:hypothetical protein